VNKKLGLMHFLVFGLRSIVAKNIIKCSYQIIRVNKSLYYIYKINKWKTLT